MDALIGLSHQVSTLIVCISDPVFILGPSLHATKPDCMFFDGASAICDDKFAMCYPCKLTLKDVAALLSPIFDVHLATLSH